MRLVVTVWGGLIALLWGTLSLVWFFPFLLALYHLQVLSALIVWAVSPMFSLACALWHGVDAYFSGRTTLLRVVLASLGPAIHIHLVLQSLQPYSGS